MGKSLPQQIIGSFEDIGKDVVSETVKLPSDIAERALESLGAKSGPKNNQQKFQSGSDEKKSPVADDFDRFSLEHRQEIRKVIARNALTALATRTKTHEPSVWERINQEAEEKKETEKHQKHAARKTLLPDIRGKRARGDLYGLAAKRHGSEIGKNARQD